MIKKLSIFIIFIVLPSMSFAGVDLPFSTTYDCAEWAQGSALTCDGLSTGGSWTCSGGYGEQITSSANNPSGSGGKGQRHWEGDGNSNNSGSLVLYFNDSQSELWIRWYMRYQEGFQWETLECDKLLYIYGDGANDAQVVPEFYSGDHLRLTTQASGVDYNQAVCDSCGWTTIMGGATSDGLWHCHEVHLKLDTDGTDGIAQWWVDGSLVIDETDVDFGGTITGWARFTIGSNQDDPNNGACEYVDFDDLVVNNTGYIGLLNGVCSLSGTITENVTETDITDGGETIILTLTGDTWDSDIGTDCAATTALIQGLDSNKSEATGWNAKVRDLLTYTEVVRTSDTVATITLHATNHADYNIIESETITVTVPAAALTTGTEAVTANPTFTIGFEATGGASMGAGYNANGPAAAYGASGITIN